MGTDFEKSGKFESGATGTFFFIRLPRLFFKITIAKYFEELSMQNKITSMCQ